ncbi:MAG: hypothetical protein KAW56_06320 [Candidatus Marinimicrobia bacterium]|nr:hypothetical protein [Candidatus Neomarinimicrobiota bacterium]
MKSIAGGKHRLLNPTFAQFYEGSILSQSMQDYKVVDLLCTEDGYFVLLSYPSSYQLSIRSSGEKILGITTKVDKRNDKIKRFCIWCGDGSKILKPTLYCGYRS